MLFLLLPLLAALLPSGEGKAGFEDPISFYVLQTSSFYNRSWVQNLGSGWLSDLETHRWQSDSDVIALLRPWSRGNFSNKELLEIETIFHMHYIRFIREIHSVARNLQFEYPFVLQMAVGCALHSGEVTEGFLRKAYQGSDLLSLQNNSWVPSPQGGSRAQHICRLLNLFGGLKETVHRLLTVTCPRFLFSLLEAGKADIQRQVRPKAWLSSGPSPGPGRLQLVCHVSGFYPKPIQVMWMRGDKEQLGTRRGGVLPHADGTWYLRVTLEVVAGEADELSCRVKHSSLEGQEMMLYWEHRSSMGFILLAVVVLLAVLTALVFWFRKRWRVCLCSSALHSLLPVRVRMEQVSGKCLGMLGVVEYMEQEITRVIRSHQECLLVSRWLSYSRNKSGEDSPELQLCGVVKGRNHILVVLAIIKQASKQAEKLFGGDTEKEQYGSNSEEKILNEQKSVKHCHNRKYCFGSKSCVLAG
ncbi:T-cell surface glycoprotein CD1a-like [Lepus europaeus]|uniref:T-cell surface glycoprotein CD1a-like n=1 Tax=Lepus europaeus TaxID=9983 RepID=UPI002B49F9E7|nr:T-cell surface glycoprotein CD1a-like [Lepus europaeus]